MMDVKHFNKSEALKDGTTITIRAIHSKDKQIVVEAFHTLERESRYMRFLGFKDHITDEELKKFTELDFENEVALVVTRIEAGKEVMIGGARYILLPASPDAGPRAEVAFIVAEDYQGQRLAGRLFEHLADIACAKGVRTFEAEVLPSNKAMLAVFARKGLPMNKKHVDGLIHVSLALKNEGL